jgi:RNA polymerase sigma factor (TIGR02999 family)
MGNNRPLESESSESVTALLLNWRQGDQAAAEKLISTIYDQLRRMAQRHLRDERRGHTLQPTALVHELYLKLFQGEPIDWQNRTHFFAVAAQQLRRIVVNHARDRQAQKRGGKRLKVSLSEVNGLAQPQDQDLLELDQALSRLEEVDARAARVIELRFFAGLTEVEAAEALDISLATLKRDWAFGRAWLLRHLGS